MSIPYLPFILTPLLCLMPHALYTDWRFVIRTPNVVTVLMRSHSFEDGSFENENIGRDPSFSAVGFRCQTIPGSVKPVKLLSERPVK